MHFQNIQTKAANKDATVPLGLISDRPSYFVLSGQNGEYNSVGDVQDWMQRNLSRLGTRTLRQLCVPSSHNSGMSKFNFSTFFASIGNVATQYVSVNQQLGCGIRYFDIRPVLHQNIWSCGHWTFIEPKAGLKVSPFGTWQGGNGETIQEIIKGINDFTASSHELIVLSIYRAFSIHESGGAFQKDDFSELDSNQWRDLLDTFTGETGIKQLWRPIEANLQSKTIDLTSIPLRTFIGEAKAAVILLVDNKVEIANRRGCFHDQSWPWDYSDWQKPEDERLQAFLNQASQPNPKPYSYSGCHTQNEEEAILSKLGQSSKSVLELAKSSKDKLFTQLFPACSEAIYPCSMTMDAIDSSDLTALALAMNDRSST